MLQRPDKQAARVFDWSRLGRARNVIYALAGVAFVALLAWRIDTLWYERARILEGARGAAEIGAAGLATYADRTLDTANLLAEDVRDFVVSHGGVGTVSRDALQTFIALKASQISAPDYVMVADPTGQPIALSERREAPVVSLADRSWFMAARAGRDNFIGAAVRSRLGRNYVYTYTKRIVGADGAFQGVVDVAIRVPEIRDPRERAPGEALTELWTEEGQLVVSNFMLFDRKGNVTPQRPPLRPWPKETSGFASLAGGNAILAFHRANGRHVIAAVVLDRSEVLQRWHWRIAQSAALLALAGVVLALLARIAGDLAERDNAVRRTLEQTTHALSSALAQRDLLLREIHHRVKNSLQVTSSIIQLQSRQFEDERVRDAFARAQLRLQAISLVHDVLYQDKAEATIDLAKYLQRLANEIARAHNASEHGIGLALELAPVALPTEQATSLGLWASEVLVNAFRHAFPPDQTGTIRIVLTTKDGLVDLAVEDNGQGLAAERDRGALGMRLINSLAAQLHGKVDIVSASGTTVRLEFPIARAKS